MEEKGCGPLVNLMDNESSEIFIYPWSDFSKRFKTKVLIMHSVTAMLLSHGDIRALCIHLDLNVVDDNAEETSDNTNKTTMGTMVKEIMKTTVDDGRRLRERKRCDKP